MSAYVYGYYMYMLICKLIYAWVAYPRVIILQVGGDGRHIHVEHLSIILGQLYSK